MKAIGMRVRKSKSVMSDVLLLMLLLLLLMSMSMMIVVEGAAPHHDHHPHHPNMNSRNNTRTNLSPLTSLSGILLSALCALALVWTKQNGQRQAFSPHECAVVLVTPSDSSNPNNVSARFLASRGFTVFQLIVVNKNNKNENTEPNSTKKDNQTVLKKKKNNNKPSSSIDQRIIPIVVTDLRMKSSEGDKTNPNTDDDDLASSPTLSNAVQQVQQGLAARQKQQHASQRLVAMIHDCSGGVASHSHSVTQHTAVASSLLETNVLQVIQVTKAFAPLLLTTTTTTSASESHQRHRPEQQQSKPKIINVGSYYLHRTNNTVNKTNDSSTTMNFMDKNDPETVYQETSQAALAGLTQAWRQSFHKQIGVTMITVGTDHHEHPQNQQQYQEHATLLHHVLQEPTDRLQPRYYAGTVQGMPTEWWCWLHHVLPSWIMEKFW